MRLVHIKVKTRDLGYGHEEVEGDAYVTNKVDLWGKRTILIDTGAGYEHWYLFSDEYKEIPS